MRRLRSPRCEPPQRREFLVDLDEPTARPGSGSRRVATLEADPEPA
jgi:hypothetical protein